ncbi:16S rRNA methyltransferase [Paenibacillus swuensis]|uniref:Ribosomal RNA small subunit methyltransferase G n=1 Tax=Paenibacillus swuensis TaxID=1178515 RepID=A0A172TG63_9BACL|nr:16S rRNA (guanine(527)-N(7))-methyltransferase RsmG [Paenibacillus swuensis]ANE46031.1 16S rRNA methyltransferase [Paenibacillus swuensis]
MDNVKEQFTSLLAERGLILSETQWNQFEIYLRELVSWNEKMNLTGITERSQVYLKHFYDSISLAFYVPMDAVKNLADIGSGAGFPSIPLKIMFPHVQVTIVDSLNKRIQFLKHLVSEIGLDGVQCVHGRAEDLARKPELRDAFDLVTARAVARMNVLNEFCLPFVSKHGLFVAMKGSDPSEEVAESKGSLIKLNSRLKEVHSFKLPIEESDRHIIIVDKLDRTPKAYPRKAGTPLKEPLM